MKVVLFFLVSIFILSCQQEGGSKVTSDKVKDYDFSKKSNSISATDDFSDLKKEDDESCETEEEISKKLAAPKQEAFQLQGGDSGCEVDGHK
ncbi:hypothetical protein [Halobacteriovorax sp. HLS]|uniref:hypothetical protein n=1 Tax=Halobacteriovorax sp. HLS TaxID=2234000 RepID=UPI000FD75692|nr:hypothetical protein [Halobacteriovorax sp. HLS]